jgi:hypothetical protein
VLIAELRRDRLHAVLPRLQQRLAAAVAQENALRWDARYRRVAAMAEEAAEKFRAYPRLAAELVELMNLAAALDREASAVNISAARANTAASPASNCWPAAWPVSASPSRRLPKACACPTGKPAS